MNKNLYKIITIGLIVSLVFMIGGLIFGVFDNITEGDLIETSEDNIKLDQLFLKFEDYKDLSSMLLSSIGILILVTIPIVSVIFVLFYFLIKKNYKLFLISSGVLLALILSAISGFLL